MYRLEFSLGLVNKPDEAMDMAELAVQAGLPGEAKDIVDKSFAGGLLGTGPEASRHQRLKNLVNKAYADGQAKLGKEDADAATDHDGNRLLRLGETYVSYGDFAHGLPMMEQALGKDDLHHPEDAKLQLGLPYWKAGQAQRAINELRTWTARKARRPGADLDPAHQDGEINQGQRDQRTKVFASFFKKKSLISFVLF